MSSLDIIKRQLQFIPSNKNICGLVTTTEGTIFDLNCLFCTEMTNNFIEFIAHIYSRHENSFQVNKDNIKINNCNESEAQFESDRDGTKNDVETDLHISVSDDMKDIKTVLEEDNNDRPKGRDIDDDDEIEVSSAMGIADDGTVENGEQISSLEIVQFSSDLDVETEDINDCFNEKGPPTESEKKQIKHLINLYKQHPVLWDHRIDGYTNAQIKNKAYVEISDEMNLKFNNQQTPQLIKRRILNLRSKLKKEQQTESENGGHISSLWYRDLLSFTLIDNEVKESSITKENIEYLIDLYKQYPVLWDYRTSGYRSSIAKGKAYVKISEAMCEKFGRMFTPQNVKKRILGLCSKFKKELDDISSNKIETSSLWFYERLSYIAGYCMESSRPIVNQENLFDGKQSLLSNERNQIEHLINLYRQYPVLWDQRIHQNKNILSRSKAYVKITEAMKEKFKNQLITENVKQKILSLRSKFKKELHDMVKSKRTTPHLWYFEQLSFIMQSDVIDDKDNEINQQNGFKCAQVMNIDYLIEFEEHKNLNSDFIEYFKNCPCLWDQQDSNYTNQQQRKEGRKYIIKSMNDKWDIGLTENQLLQKISIINFLYNSENSSRKSLRAEDNTNKSEEPWYYSKLNFLEKKKAKKIQIMEAGQYKCEVCLEMFTYESSLKNHLFLKHNIKSFACEICKKLFPNSHGLEGHLKTHLSVEDRPYACQFCGAKFATKVNCSVHERRHTKKFLYSCTLCPKRFVTSTDFKIHMRKHTGEKPYICHVCGKSFRNASSIACHRRTHSELRTYKCTICMKSFHNRNIYRDHIKTHSNNRDNICNVCNKSFKVRKTLLKHMLLHSDSKT